MNQKQLKKNLNKILKEEWIENKFPKNKNGGAGNTLESLLGIQENNASSPDIGKFEIKTTNINHKKLISLFTYDKNIWNIDQVEAIKKYGTKNKDGRIGLYFTLSRKPNVSNLYTYVSKTKIQVREGENVLLDYCVSELTEKFNKKMSNTVLVYFERRKNEGKTEFNYKNAFLYNANMTNERLVEMFENEIITIDMRLHISKTGSSRNHGTGLRVHENNLEELFDGMIKLV